jgi:hypothetical protein
MREKPMNRPKFGVVERVLRGLIVVTRREGSVWTDGLGTNMVGRFAARKEPSQMFFERGAHAPG